MPRGVITRYDPMSGTGVITAEDGRTYPFRLADVAPGSRPPTRGGGAGAPGPDGAGRALAFPRPTHDNDNDKD
ncbi:hypothetical protein [Kitasatospora cinereorecta]|uniref:Cold-shock protein n=1 Tax=Kitasatospora cinereorecta TaxID=285560 RepID=A0ABW0V9L0_9ACTN